MMIGLVIIAEGHHDQAGAVAHLLGEWRVLGLAETRDASRRGPRYELVATACPVALGVLEDERHLVACPAAEVALDLGLGYSVVALAGLDRALNLFSG